MSTAHGHTTPKPSDSKGEGLQRPLYTTSVKSVEDDGLWDSSHHLLSYLYPFSWQHSSCDDKYYMRKVPKQLSSGASSFDAHLKKSETAILDKAQIKSSLSSYIRSASSFRIAGTDHSTHSSSQVSTVSRPVLLRLGVQIQLSPVVRTRLSWCTAPRGPTPGGTTGQIHNRSQKHQLNAELPVPRAVANMQTSYLRVAAWWKCNSLNNMKPPLQGHHCDAPARCHQKPKQTLVHVKHEFSSEHPFTRTLEAHCTSPVKSSPGL